MNRGPYVFNAAGIAINGLNARDYPIPRNYYFAKDNNDPKIDYSKYIYNEFGFNKLGLDCYGRNELGEDYYAVFGRDASEFDDDGYDKDGFNLNGYNREGYTREECIKQAKKIEKEKKYVYPTIPHSPFELPTEICMDVTKPPVCHPVIKGNLNNKI